MVSPRSMHGVPNSDGRRFQCADGNAVRRRNSRQHAERLSAQISAAIRSTRSARMSTHTRYSEYSRSAHTKLLYLLTQRGAGAYVRTGGTFLTQCLRRRIHDSAALRSELRVLRRKRRNCCREVRVRRRQLRVRRRELFIPRRQCVDLSGVPASCTLKRLVRGVERCRTRGTSRWWRFVCAAHGARHGRRSAYRVAIGARCAKLLHPRLEVGQAEASLLLGEQRSWRLGSCTSACSGVSGNG